MDESEMDKSEMQKSGNVLFMTFLTLMEAGMQWELRSSPPLNCKVWGEGYRFTRNELFDQPKLDY